MPRDVAAERARFDRCADEVVACATALLNATRALNEALRRLIMERHLDEVAAMIPVDLTECGVPDATA